MKDENNGGGIRGESGKERELYFFLNFFSKCQN